MTAMEFEIGKTTSAFTTVVTIDLWQKKKLLCPLKFCYHATKQDLTAQVRGLETTEDATKTITELYQNANSKGLFAIVLTEC